VFKLNLKNRLQEHSKVVLTRVDFEDLLYKCIADVKPEQQQHAARFNNRAYMFQMLSELLDPRVNVSRMELEQRVIDE